MIKWGDVFFHENSIFMKKWTGDDFRLMTRVLPRPLVLQGGKSFDSRSSNPKESVKCNRFFDLYAYGGSSFWV